MRATILEGDLDKKELIRWLSGKGRSLMFFYEDPPGPNLLSERISDTISIVHPPYGYEAMKSWLYPGNWQAICPPNSDYQPFDTFRSDTTIIGQRMREWNVEIIIDSFHDDIEWNVIIQPDL